MSALSILYVDDEPDIREVAVFSLGLDAAIEVRAVESGAAALQLLADPAWSPDAILLDVMMPVLDGPATLERLRALPAHGRTPVVFITASVQAHEQARLMALGATAVIAKPFDPMTLASQLRAALAAHGR
jgi:two-component system OmpR family response regulator